MGTAAAIDPGRTMSQYVREHWGPERGFPAGPVYSITQTPDGYLWIGTEKGLVRFDGFTFELIQHSHPGLPALNRVLGLLSTPDGSLWIRLRRPTLLRYREGEFENMTERFPRSSVAHMTRAQDGLPVLWVLHGEPAAMRIQQDKVETIATPAGFTRSPVLAMAQTANGDLWVGTRDAGLFRIRNGQTEAIKDGLPDRKINTLVPVGQNELWIGTDAGIVRWDGAKLAMAGVPTAFHGVQALTMTVDRDANLWVGTNSQGLLRLNRGGELMPDQPLDTRPLPHAVTALFEDREGNVWVGSDSGLTRIRDSPFISYSQPEGLPTEGGTPVFVDGEGRTWFAPARGGLWWFKDGRHGQVKSDGLDQDVVYCLTGRGSELWAGRQHGGLTRLLTQGERITAQTYTKADGLAQNSVYAVHAAQDGSIWAGTLSGGLSRLANGRFINFTAASGLASNTVNAVLEDAAGTIWVATPAGLSAFANGRWQSFTAQSGLSSTEIYCLLEDAPGTLWVGTSAGLGHFRQGRFELPPGLPAPLRQRVLGLAKDHNGALWIATATSVLRVHPDHLRAGNWGEGSLREYGREDGLRGTEGVRRFPSVLADAGGRVWFALNQGLSVVTPDRLRSTETPVIAHVRGISVDGKPVPLSGPLHIGGGSHRVHIGYAGLSLAVPDKVRYRLQLEGFDRGWGDPTTARDAVYTNLPPGPYRFRVAASNPDGVWNSNEASLPFEVDPLYWQTWWFRLSAALGLALGALWLHHRKLKQVKQQLNVRFEERLAERTRIAQELHDTLLQGFLSASLQVHVATQKLPDETPAKPMLARAQRLMRQVIDEGRNTVRGLRMGSHATLDLEQAFWCIQEEMLPESTRGAQLQVTVQGTPRPLHPLLRDEVYRIGREALINAFRHAEGQLIELQLTYEAHQLRMIVRDDGRGLDPQVLASGREGHWGLSGMRERARQIGARLTILNRPSGGLEVHLHVPGPVAFQNFRESKWTKWKLGRSPITKGIETVKADLSHEQ